MRRLLELCLIATALLLMLLTQVSALGIFPNYYPPYGTQGYNKVEITNIHQFIDLGYSGSDIQTQSYFYIYNKSAQLPSDFLIAFNFFEKDTSIAISNINVSVCSELSNINEDKVFPFTQACNNSISFKQNITNGNLLLTVNLSEINNSQFYIFIKHTASPELIKKTGDYHIVWINTVCNAEFGCPKNDAVTRKIMLPSTAIFQDKNNFDIIKIQGDRWILNSNGYGDAVIWFKDKGDDFKDKANWLAFGVFFSLISSLMFLFMEDHLKKINKIFLGAPFLIFTWMFFVFFLFFMNPSVGNFNLVILSLIPLGLLWFGLIIVAIIALYQNRKEIKEKILSLFNKLGLPKMELKTVRSQINLELIILPILFVLSLLIFDTTRKNYGVILTIMGLILLTLGSIIALRPTLREYLDPNLKDKKLVKTKNVNASFFAYAQMIMGLSLQLWALLMILIGSLANVLWFSIFATVLIFVIDWFYIRKTIKDLNFTG